MEVEVGKVVVNPRILCVLSVFVNLINIVVCKIGVEWAKYTVWGCKSWKSQSTLKKVPMMAPMSHVK